MKKLHIKTFGCQMNEYDSAKMADVLKSSHDLTLTEDAERADVLLLNTCSIREKAQEKLFHQLGRWRRYKATNAHVVIGVGGCVASQEGEAILKRAPYVDMIFGPQTLHRLPNMLNNVLEKRDVAIDVSFPEIEKFDHLPKPNTSAVSAFVSIMEGCSKYCSFCVVPYTRGEEFSRPFHDVMKEIEHLAEQGVREVNLLGQNVNAYRDFTEDGSEIDLAMLIYFVAKISGIKRIRYTTSHPIEFSQALIDVYAEVPELVSHLHLPIQSGSDTVLMRMKRQHTVLEYQSKIRKLRAIRPDLSLSSDFIVGFPGESATEFAETMMFIKEMNFDRSFSFIYSQRPGTPASLMKDDIDLSEKKQRLQQLQSLLNESERAVANAMLGSKQTLLVEGKSARYNTLVGRTENNRATHFAGDDTLIGQLVDVEVTKVDSHSLHARLL